MSLISQPSRISREEYRKQKEEEALRKAGEAVPLKDEQGNEINPHIPSFITKAPWYADTGAPSLSHQRLQEDTAPHLKLDEWYDRGAKAGPAAKKYRKGACENCGAMTHKRKDCVERPRKRGAKFSGKDIQADEVVQEFKGDYDAKRDRWNGYDPASYKAVVEEYEATEAARRAVREKEVDSQKFESKAVLKKAAKDGTTIGEDEDFGSSDEDDQDEDKYAESADQVGQKVDTKTRITVRNLRIREDTAKYLINLDIDSAHYDPKTRSMRDAPEEGIKREDMRFAGDNFTRYSGDATNMQKLQLFAWQSGQRGNSINISSNPTAAERLNREFLEKKEVMKDTTKTSILAKYGGEEHLEKLPRELLTGQTEDYVEYSRTGNVIKGREKAKAKSKYDEDVYINNHTSVWGSFYDRENGRWGYACCHSLISGSYCTGDAGKTATKELSTAAILAAGSDSTTPPPEQDPYRRKTLAEERADAMAKADADSDAAQKAVDATRAANQPNWAKRVDANEAVEIDRERLRKALAEEKKRKAMGEDEAWQQTKKAKADITQEELEAYRLSRSTYEDPMANYKDEEEN